MIQDIAPRHLDNHFRPEQTPEPHDLVFCVRGRQCIVNAAAPGIVLPQVSQLPEAHNLIYAFSIRDSEDVPGGPSETRFFIARDATIEPPEGFEYFEVRKLRYRPESPKELVFAAFTALHLDSWYSHNVYCGVCGTTTEHDIEERMLRCPNCGNMIFPRLQPAVIVAVRNGERLLMTKYAHGRGVAHYALIAGFCEIGETVEETVQREVSEEVGLRVRNLTYYKSQPWGTVDDLLLGYFCDVDGSDEIERDQNELAVAEWVLRDEIEGQPDDLSLTNEMMMRFHAGLDQVPPERP